MSASAAHVLPDRGSGRSGAYYAHGGAGPHGFDCSGFTMYVFSKVGISLPHSSSAQRGVVQSVSSPQPGDLVFVYNGGGGSVGHVAIYAGGGYWWEASNPSTGVGQAPRLVLERVLRSGALGPPRAPRECGLTSPPSARIGTPEPSPRLRGPALSGLRAGQPLERHEQQPRRPASKCRTTAPALSTGRPTPAASSDCAAEAGRRTPAPGRR